MSLCLSTEAAPNGSATSTAPWCRAKREKREQHRLYNTADPHRATIQPGTQFIQQKQRVTALYTAYTLCPTGLSLYSTILYSRAIQYTAYTLYSPIHRSSITSITSARYTYLR